MTAFEQTVLATVPSAVDPDSIIANPSVAELLRSLKSAVAGKWWVVDTHTGDAIAVTEKSESVRAIASGLPSHWVSLCNEVKRQGRVEFVSDEEPLLGLAVPVPNGAEPRYVAVGVFVSIDLLTDRATVERRASDIFVRQFGWQPAIAQQWLAAQIPWPAERLQAVAELVLSRVAEQRRIDSLVDEAARMSLHLTELYEEISLWHRLTRHLRISENEEELGRTALEWLSAAVPAESLVLQLLSDADASGSQISSSHAFFNRGSYPLEEEAFNGLIRALGLDREVRTVILNPPISDAQLADFDALRQLIIVPLASGENLIGWLAAINHAEGQEFGSPEASLLASVGAILGIHAGNLSLYRQQAEMLSGIVRALTSAIDAKDPYTCGHSDRVAQIAVALAAELGCNRKQLDTIYLSGLLHDVGKIGINDSVLRKPGKLSDAEYEHIKMHPEIGFRILHDLKQLGDVLPVVRHHHEAWDGRGYPCGLAGDQIPQMARIVAVADAFDAMSSDRPYRKGMADSRLDEILRDGAGKQWDAEVVDAFFRVRAKIREICGHDRAHDPLPEEVRRMS